ncbi:MAG: type II secretion system F family protein [Planctomycetota bacterium]|nr:type II secretion system F family protein [Planctomycetota bacterium]
MPNALAIAYYNLSSMLDAGVPVLRSLNTITPGMKPRMRKAFLALADCVSQGDPMADAMSRHPRVFKPVDVMIMEVAEKSGNLPDLIGLLSKWHEMAHRTMSRMLSGLMYPVMILTIAAFVFPLPGFILGESSVWSYLYTVVAILMLFWVPASLITFIIRTTPRTGPIRRVFDRLVLRIPVLGAAMHKLAVSRYCWTFHLLCKAGVPISDCVEMAIAACGNAAVGDLFLPAIDSVRAGGSMSEGYSSKLPLDVAEMWKMGEETGQLDDVSKRLADSYSEQAEFGFAEFARWMPILVYFLILCVLTCMIFMYAGAIVSRY